MKFPPWHDLPTIELESRLYLHLDENRAGWISGVLGFGMAHSLPISTAQRYAVSENSNE